MTLISDFLANNVFGVTTPDLADFAKLEGCDLHELTLFNDIEDCKAVLRSSTPVYVLPVGGAAGFPIGLHLRPKDIAERRLAFVSIQDETTLIEFAGSPRHLVTLSLLRMEGVAMETDDTEALDEAVRKCNEIFGPNFFVPGTHGTFAREDAEEIAADEFGPAPAYCFEAAVFAEDRQERRRFLREGIEMEPGCMALHTKLAIDYAKTGDEQPAAIETAAALGCYHHTAYITNLDKLYAQGRALLDQYPDVFSEFDKKDLLMTDERDRLRWVIELYEAGEVELGTKLLCDMCHTLTDYDSVLPIFRRHFEKLDWQWALELCNLRDGHVIHS
jgi:hypothetical protein